MLIGLLDMQPKSGTLTEMLELTKDNYFGVETTGITAEDIQAAIDKVNNDVIFGVNGLDKKAESAADQAKVTALIQAWIEDDVAPAKDKAEKIQASKEKEAAFRVVEATTENSLYNALVAYANITKDNVLKASELNVNLKAEYKKALDTDGVQADLVNQIKTDHADANNGVKAKIVTVADGAALTATIGDVNTTAAAYDATDAKTITAFQKLCKIS